MTRSPAAVRRRPLAGGAAEVVSCRPLGGDGWSPALVSPRVAGLDLFAWARLDPDLPARWLREHGALLFRDFDGQSAAQLADVVAATSDGTLLDYTDRTTPREALGGKLYTSTAYPAARRIELHNEGTYWQSWPLKLYFACDVAPEGGGETPLAHVARVLDRLSPATRARFEALGFTLIRHFNDGFGLPWQEVFQTQDRSEVARYCHSHDIEFAWRDGDRLSTRQTRPAIRVNPATGARVWFNHAAFFHVSAYAGPDRDALEAELGADHMPYATTYGDGNEIAAETVAEILAAYRAEERRFRWQAGDVLLLDNMSVAHGRQPFTGARRILVVMAEPYGG